jgi:hypothetical protein
MSITELGALGEFVGSILTIATLIYLAMQLRQNTAQQRREEIVAIQHGQNSVLAQLQDAKVVRAYARAADGDHPASIEDRAMAIIWVIQYLNHFQIVHEAYLTGTINEESYERWAGFVANFVAPKGIREWWDGESGRLAFSPEIRNLIDEKLEDAENPSVPFNEMWAIFKREAWEDDSTSL